MFWWFWKYLIYQVLRSNYFTVCSERLPYTKFYGVIIKYPYLNKDRLGNKLININSGFGKHLSPEKLLLASVIVYMEVSKLIFLLPVTTNSSEMSMSTLERTKTNKSLAQHDN